MNQNVLNARNWCILSAFLSHFFVSLQLFKWGPFGRSYPSAVKLMWEIIANVFNALNASVKDFIREMKIATVKFAYAKEPVYFHFNWRNCQALIGKLHNQKLTNGYVVQLNIMIVDFLVRAKLFTIARLFNVYYITVDLWTKLAHWPL